MCTAHLMRRSAERAACLTCACSYKPTSLRRRPPDPPHPPHPPTPTHARTHTPPPTPTPPAPFHLHTPSTHHGDPASPLSSRTPYQHCSCCTPARAARRRQGAGSRICQGLANACGAGAGSGLALDAGSWASRLSYRPHTACLLLACCSSWACRCHWADAFLGQPKRRRAWVPLACHKDLPPADAARVCHPGTLATAREVNFQALRSVRWVLQIQEADTL